MTFQGSRQGLLEVAKQRPLTKIKDTVITAGQEPPETLTRGSGLVLCPAWNLLPVRPFLSKTHESTLIFLQGHMFLHAPTGHHSGGIIGNIFILFGHPGDFQLLILLSQLPLPQSPPVGRRLSQCPLWTQGLASCQHTQLLLCSPGYLHTVAWQNLLKKGSM